MFNIVDLYRLFFMWRITEILIEPNFWLGPCMHERTRKKCILEELPNSSETEDMRRIR